LKTAGPLLCAVALIAAMMVGQPLQRSADLLPIAASAGVVTARLATQQPTRPDPLGHGPRSRRRLATIAPPATTFAVVAALRRSPLAVGRSARRVIPRDQRWS
jgi:hypothetical protein